VEMGVNRYLLKKNSAYKKENCYYTDNILNFHTLSYLNTKKKEHSVFVEIYFKTIPVTYGGGVFGMMVFILHKPTLSGNSKFLISILS
jgi:hypothetical protein